MSKRPLAQAVIAYVGGIMLLLCKEWYIPPGTLFLFAVMNVDWIKGRKSKTLLVLFAVWIVFFWAGFHQTQKEQSYRARYADCLEKEMPAVLQGMIYKKEKKNEQYLIYLTNVTLRVNNQNYSTNQVLVYLNTDEYRIGKTIVVKGNIKKFKNAVNEGGFDQQAYYQSLKIDYKFEIEELCGSFGTADIWKEKINLIGEKLKQNYTSMTNANYASILCTMILGDKNALDPETKIIYQHAGISHILVISGLHISMLGMGIYGLLRRCKGGLVSSVALAGVFLLFYAQLTGWGVSTIRAVVMFGLAMLAKCLGKTYDRITALAIAVLVLLMNNPYLVSYAGFQLSVGAIVGIILAGEQAGTWRMSGMIQLVTIPLLLLSFSEIPVWSLIVNMLILPFSGCLLVSGLIGTVTGSVWLWLGRITVFPACMILWFYEKVCRVVDQLPFSMWVMGHPSKWQLILYYVILFWGVQYFGRMQLLIELKCSEENKKNSEKERRAGCKTNECSIQKWLNDKKADEKRAIKKELLCFRTYGIRKLIWIFGLFLLLILKLPHQTRIDILDVGQGDGICMQLASGKNIFIDGGSTDVSQVGQYRILPYLKYNGIGQIDYWFVSHMDTDHVSGLIEALENSYPVKQIVISSTAGKNKNWEKLLKEAKKNHTKISYMKPGDMVRSGDASIQCIFPKKDYPVDDINARSMVLLFQEKKFRAILVGDITSVEETWLLENTRLSNITWYKAAHHGSKYSNSRAWLKRLSPQIATISYGENNWYGHPNKEAVTNMEKSGSEVFKTAKLGQIQIMLTENGMKIRNYRNPLEVRCYPMLE